MFRGRLSEHDKNLDHTRITSGTRNGENQSDAIQKQIQSYTQKFQQEKRKLFRAQQNHREIMKDYQNQIDNFQQFKSQKQITNLHAKIKCLEINLQKGIASYNQALSKNNMLKNEIDQLRKDKKNQKQAFRMLAEKIEELNSSIKQLDCSITTKKSKVQKTKQQIIQFRDKNQRQNNQYLKYVQKLKDDQNQIRQSIKNTILKQTTQASDTTPIVKLRIRNLIIQNKEKIRVTQLYKKSMEKIEQSFEQIKQESGINDLEEITKTFLKQQEQNTLIFQYIHKLTTQLEMIREDNDKLQQKINKYQEVVNQHRSSIDGTPEQQQEKAKIQSFYLEKHKYIQKLNKFLKSVQPSIVKIFKLQKKENESIVSHSNIQNYLASLQQLINQKYHKNKQQTIGSEIKQDFTKYCKIAPNISTDDLKDRNEQSMLEQPKFRDYASQFWEKKRLNR